MTGTGAGARIGRPVAGKTGTTTLNKDGWFLGFSSGLTTGIWMGRDDSKVVPGLQGGRAPARAFHDFMARAVASRPVENFEIKVELPEWATPEPDQETWFNAPEDRSMVDEDGSAPAPGPAAAPSPQPDESRRQDEEPRLDQDWIDRATDRDPPRPPREPREPRRDQDAATPPDRRSGSTPDTVK
jgi:penicillin-binding protein 1A